MGSGIPAMMDSLGCITLLSTARRHDRVDPRRGPAMTIAEPTTTILTDSLIDRCGQRAPDYDRENRFFDEDFEELKQAGYLLLNVPTEFGGHGLSLLETCHQQRRLAYRAPATALAVNMHLYWVGIAADLWRMGDTSLEWLLREAAAGEVF